MTYPNMRSGSPAPRPLLPDRGYFRLRPRAESPLPQTRAASPAPNAILAANDDEPRKWYEIRNPLWVIVIGMGVLFGAMAFIVASG
jgi:hypothetical protein